MDTILTQDLRDVIESLFGEYKETGAISRENRQLPTERRANWCYAMNLLQEYRVLAYEVRDKNDELTTYIAPKEKGKKKYCYTITEFDKNRLDWFCAKFDIFGSDRQRRILLDQLIEQSESDNTLMGKVRRFARLGHQDLNLNADIIPPTTDEGKKSETTPAELHFDGTYFTVKASDYIYHFTKNLRDSLPMEILQVAAQEDNMGDSFTKNSLEKYGIKVRKNLKEVFKGNLFGERNPLSPFVEMTPSAIKIKRHADLSQEQVDSISKAADNIQQNNE